MEKIQPSNKPLFISDNKELYYSDFIKALKEVGVSKGDNIFVHSDISVFGKLAELNKDILLNGLSTALMESSKGTVIMPTFTYSYCWNQVFDHKESKSTVGVLSEYFRNLPDAVRTTQPIFSVAMLPCKQDFLDLSKDCFGQDSIFGRLHREKAKIVFFGAKFEAVTFLHHIEQSYGVPYRYMKRFDGTFKMNGKEIKDYCTYFVRHEDVKYELSRFEEYLLKRGLLKRVKIGNGEILSAEAEVLYNEGFKLLDKDINFFRK